MAHELDVSNGRANIAYTGNVPWRGLGFQVKPDQDIDTWRAAAGLNWEALKAPTYYEVDDRTVDTGEFALYRSDTGARLGTVSQAYREVQPAEVLDFFRHYVENIGAFQMDTVGSLKGGKHIWGLAKARDGFFEAPGGDVVQRYLLMATSYDKTMATTIQQTSIRVVCNNTLTAAFMQGERRVDPVVRVSHHAKFDGVKVRESMLFDQQWAGFTEAVGRWADRHVDRSESDDFFRSVFEMKQPIDDKERAKQQIKLVELHEVFQTAPGQELESARDSVWGLVNTVTYLVDHKLGQNADNRMTQAWFGQRRYMKRRAIEAADRLVTA